MLNEYDACSQLPLPHSVQWLCQNKNSFLAVAGATYSAQPEAHCNPKPVATSRVSCVYDWLSDANGLDSGDRSWICNTGQVLFDVGHNLPGTPVVGIEQSAAVKQACMMSSI